MPYPKKYTPAEKKAMKKKPAKKAMPKKGGKK